MDPTQIAIRGMTAKMDSIERMMSELMGTVQDMGQQIKLIRFDISKGYDSASHIPKGESDSQLCESCGRRRPRTELMKKTKQVGDSLVVYSECKGCFYGRK